MIPPLFSAGDNVFEQDIIRNISFGSFNIDLRRSTGIIDNIHVSTLLLLYLIFIYYFENKKKLFLFFDLYNHVKSAKHSEKMETGYMGDNP